jgi:hypothetical protein
MAKSGTVDGKAPLAVPPLANLGFVCNKAEGAPGAALLSAQGDQEPAEWHLS